MKNANSVKNEGLAAWAVTLLRALPGAPVVGEALPGSTDDGSLRFSDAGLVLRVEQKAHVDPVIAHSIEDRNAGRSEPLLVVARTTTSVAREILESHGIGYVDATGNAAIDLPGLHVRTGSLVRSGSFTAGAVIAPAPDVPACRASPARRGSSPKRSSSSRNGPGRSMPWPSAPGCRPRSPTASSPGSNARQCSRQKAAGRARPVGWRPRGTAGPMGGGGRRAEGAADPGLRADARRRCPRGLLAAGGA